MPPVWDSGARRGGPPPAADHSGLGQAPDGKAHACARTRKKRRCRSRRFCGPWLTQPSQPDGTPGRSGVHDRTRQNSDGPPRAACMSASQELALLPSRPNAGFSPRQQVNLTNSLSLTRKTALAMLMRDARRRQNQPDMQAPSLALRQPSTYLSGTLAHPLADHGAKGEVESSEPEGSASKRSRHASSSFRACIFGAEEAAGGRPSCRQDCPVLCLCLPLSSSILSFVSACRFPHSYHATNLDSSLLHVVSSPVVKQPSPCRPWEFLGHHLSSSLVVLLIPPFPPTPPPPPPPVCHVHL